MMTINIDQMVEAIDALEDFHRGVILDGLELGAERGRIEVLAATPVDHGEARRGWVVKRTDEGVQLRNDTVHASVLEEGRRPGQRPPPLAPILEWVYRHAEELGIGMERGELATKSVYTPEKMTLKDGTELDAYDADALRAAWFIRSTIGARGQKALAIMGSRVELLKAFAKEEVAKEYDAK